jgi:hypothetical protein
MLSATKITTRELSMRFYTAALSILLGVPAVASADSMRCGKWVVNEESTAAEVMEKCGAPDEKEITHQDVRGVNPLGYSSKRGTTVIERWSYKRPSSLRMLVTVVDGKVKRIERAE